MGLLKKKKVPTASRKRGNSSVLESNAEADSRRAPLVAAEGNESLPPSLLEQSRRHRDDTSSHSYSTRHVSPLHVEHENHHRGEHTEEEVAVKSNKTGSIAGFMAAATGRRQRHHKGKGSADVTRRSPSPTVPLPLRSSEREQPVSQTDLMQAVQMHDDGRLIEERRAAADSINPLRVDASAPPTVDPKRADSTFGHILLSPWSRDAAPVAVREMRLREGGDCPVVPINAHIRSCPTSFDFYPAEEEENAEPVGGDYTRREQIIRDNDFRGEHIQFPSGSSGKNRSFQSFASSEFDEVEWTPQDSAYGAACPIFGWIPKNVRRIIEHTIIVLILFILVVVVVTTSMHLTNEHSTKGRNNNGGGSSSASSGGGESDAAVTDDYYVEAAGNDLDDDDYYSGEDREDERDEEDRSNSGDEDKRYARNRMLGWTGSITDDLDPYDVDMKTEKIYLRRRVGNTSLW